MADDELIAVARATAATRGRSPLEDAQVVCREPEAAVLLSDPAYARGGTDTPRRWCVSASA